MNLLLGIIIYLLCQLFKSDDLRKMPWEIDFGVTLALVIILTSVAKFFVGVVIGFVGAW